jgi:hypothetical protein
MKSIKFTIFRETMVEKFHFSIVIEAPKQKVWTKMLDKEGYEAWTSEFAAGSTFVGSWDKGAKIHFVGPEGQGMTSVIAENKPFEYISIKHLGYILKGVEDTESPEIKAWAPAYENYTISENNGVSEVKVDIEIMPGLEEYMQETWPKALTKLKSICE